jgi:hypothetical protein
VFDPFSRRCACHRPEADCHRGSLPEGYCRRGLADRYLPLVQAASLLAFGDLIFIEHQTEVRIGREGHRVQVEKGSCPPIDEAIHRLYGLAGAKQIQLIGCRSNTGRWDDIRHRFDPIPATYFELNDWGYSWLDPFPICRPFATYEVEWFFPAVERSAIEWLLLDGERGAPDEPSKGDALDIAIAEVRRERGEPGKKIQWNEFCCLVRLKCQVKEGERGYGDRTINNRVKAIRKASLK